MCVCVSEGKGREGKGRKEGREGMCYLVWYGVPVWYG